MFAFTKTRFNLLYALLLLNRFKNNLNFTHVAALQRIFRYVKKTLHLKLKYEFNQNY